MEVLSDAYDHHVLQEVPKGQLETDYQAQRPPTSEVQSTPSHHEWQTQTTEICEFQSGQTVEHGGCEEVTRPVLDKINGLYLKMRPHVYATYIEQWAECDAGKVRAACSATTKTWHRCSKNSVNALGPCSGNVCVLPPVEVHVVVLPCDRQCTINQGDHRCTSRCHKRGLRLRSGMSCHSYRIRYFVRCPTQQGCPTG